MAKENHIRVAAAYDRANEQAARIILRDQQRYGGPDGLMVLWARAVLKRLDEFRLVA